MYLEANPPKLWGSDGCYEGACGANVLNFVEDNAAGLVDSIQAHNGSHYDQQGQHLPVRARQAENVIVPHSLGGVAHDLGFLLIPRNGCGRARGRLSGSTSSWLFGQVAGCH
jgi:hypothetical protein